MALLDVNFVLKDPDLSEIFTVRRRQQVIDVHGRSTIVETDYKNVVGVINAGDPNDLIRDNPEYEIFRNTISLVTDFDLIGAMEGYLPDIVLWRGANYTAVYINQYPQFGPGFIQAVCTQTDRNDVLPPLYLNGQIALNTARNSNLIGLL